MVELSAASFPLPPAIRRSLRCGDVDPADAIIEEQEQEQQEETNHGKDNETERAKGSASQPQQQSQPPPPPSERVKSFVNGIVSPFTACWQPSLGNTTVGGPCGPMNCGTTTSTTTVEDVFRKQPAVVISPPKQQPQQQQPSSHHHHHHGKDDNDDNRSSRNISSSSRTRDVTTSVRRRPSPPPTPQSAYHHHQYSHRHGHGGGRSYGGYHHQQRHHSHQPYPPPPPGAHQNQQQYYRHGGGSGGNATPTSSPPRSNHHDPYYNYHHQHQPQYHHPYHQPAGNTDDAPLSPVSTEIGSATTMDVSPRVGNGYSNNSNSSPMLSSVAAAAGNAAAAAAAVPSKGTSSSTILRRENIEKPSTHDVLCGRGGSSNRHLGNIRFRELVAANKQTYNTLTKKQKMMIARKIVDAVHSTSGRFLAKDLSSGLFYDIGLPRSLEKTSQALREKNSNGMSSTANAAGGDEGEGIETTVDTNNSVVVGDTNNADTKSTPEQSAGESSSVPASATAKASNSATTTTSSTTTSKRSKKNIEAPPLAIPPHLMSVFGPEKQRGQQHPKSPTTEQSWSGPGYEHSSPATSDSRNNHHQPPGGYPHPGYNQSYPPPPPPPPHQPYGHHYPPNSPPSDPHLYQNYRYHHPTSPPHQWRHHGPPSTGAPSGSPVSSHSPSQSPAQSPRQVYEQRPVRENRDSSTNHHDDSAENGRTDTAPQKAGGVGDNRPKPPSPPAGSPRSGQEAAGPSSHTSPSNDRHHAPNGYHHPYYGHPSNGHRPRGFHPSGPQPFPGYDSPHGRHQQPYHHDPRYNHHYRPQHNPYHPYHPHPQHPHHQHPQSMPPHGSSQLIYRTPSNGYVRSNVDVSPERMREMKRQRSDSFSNHNNTSQSFVSSSDVSLSSAVRESLTLKDQSDGQGRHRSEDQGITREGSEAGGASVVTLSNVSGVSSTAQDLKSPSMILQSRVGSRRGMKPTAGGGRGPSSSSQQHVQTDSSPPVGEDEKKEGDISFNSLSGLAALSTAAFLKLDDDK